MLLEIILAIALGILLGTITGLTPGIHLNLIAALLISISTYLLNLFQPITLAIIIASMAITHTFLDFIPSTFLGAPNEDTALCILPAHRFLLKGEAQTAIKLSTLGSFLGLTLTISITPLLIYLSTTYYNIIKTYIPYLLILSVFFLILKEKKSKHAAILIIILSGTLGIITLNMKTIKEPLFPLLSGLFGTSTLIISLKDKIQIPIQKTISKLKLKTLTLTKVMIATLTTCTIAGFLPGVSSSQSAIISSSFFKKLKQDYFIIMVGAINTIIMIISFSALYTINKARNGAVIAISKILQDITPSELILFLSITLIVGAIATFLALKIGKTFAKYINKINYKKTCITIILIITILTIILSGPLGILILITSTAIGILPNYINCGKNHLMSCLIIPIILFFLL